MANRERRSAPRVDGEAQQLEGAGAGHRFSSPERRWETAQVTGRAKALGKTHACLERAASGRRRKLGGPREARTGLSRTGRARGEHPGAAPQWDQTVTTRSEENRTQSFNCLLYNIKLQKTSCPCPLHLSNCLEYSLNEPTLNTALWVLM